MNFDLAFAVSTGRTCLADAPIFSPNPMVGSAYRALSLRYYRTPFSAKGARLYAGRFNRVGTSALYLAFEQETALSEYHRTGPKRPCVIVTALIEASNLIDLTGDLSALSSDWREWHCDWEAARDALAGGNTTADCPSWRCGDLAIAANCAGIVFPSYQHSGGRNVVLFEEDCPGGSLKVSLVDPLREILGANPIAFGKT